MKNMTLTLCMMHTSVNFKYMHLVPVAIVKETFDNLVAPHPELLNHL